MVVLTPSLVADFKSFKELRIALVWHCSCSVVRGHRAVRLYGLERGMTMKKMIWFTCGLLVGLTALSICKASIPGKGKVTDDTALYKDHVSEMNVAKEAKRDFDSEIGHLSQLEGQYEEKLPTLARHSRLRAPMERISHTGYRSQAASSSRSSR